MMCAWKELLSILPQWLRSDGDKYRDILQEIRLRLGKKPILVCKTGGAELDRTVTMDDLNYVVNAACRYSPWTATGAASGYITAPGGHRVGICGQATVQNGAMIGLQSYRSLNIRVARDFPGIAGPLLSVPGNLLILGPPGAGKTTLLRDLICQLSHRETVAVVDERGELFPISAGRSCFADGKAVDVLSGCSKEAGIDAVLRTMAPDTVAVDEITCQQDCRALLQAGWCGVRLLATAHASSRLDLCGRNVYRPLVETKLFHTLVILQPDKSFRTERICL